ncbi:transposable element Tcb2 transposase [Trichonephila clavipes]|nr:transposable element Tcb2 transposase [Trichonephila clavipes]
MVMSVSEEKTAERVETVESRCTTKYKFNFRKKKLYLQEVLDLLQNLASEISDVLTDGFSDEEKSQQTICWNFSSILRMTIKKLNSRCFKILNELDLPDCLVEISIENASTYRIHSPPATPYPLEESECGLEFLNEVWNSECGPVCDLKTVAEVSKNERSYPTNMLTVTTGIRISRQTVCRRLNHAGLYARRPTVCIPLTSAHKRARLNWSLKHHHWSVGEWANVMFSDESRFSLSSDSRRVTIWRERGTRFEPRNITERHHFSSRGVIVWAGIIMGSLTGLHFFDAGYVTAQRYRDEVLEPYVRLFRGAVSLTSYSWMIMHHVTERC